MSWIAQFILSYLWKWKFEGIFPKNLNKYIIIVAPHTSWIDFPLGLLVKWKLSLETNFIGKSSLFKPPFGVFFRMLGGTPVDRNKNSNLVQAIVAEFDKREKFSLALSPEGTRKKVEKWKTGFYFIAKGAKVPIIMVSLDFEHRIIKIGQPYEVTENMEADFHHFEEFFKGIKGYHPELS